MPFQRFLFFTRPLMYIAVALFLLGQGPQAWAQPPESDEKPLSFPFASEPGMDTWLLGQPYGNTTSAYRMRDVIYQLSQGIHFGVDLSAPCGTEVVALTDGVVFVVDNLNFGSAPHNLIVDYPELGYASLYGHLLETPHLRVGQEVKRGEVLALSGDPAETCYGRPHLHLEIRDLQTHARKFNPLTLMEGDWVTISSIGAFGRGFEYDLDNPRKWQHLFDQPEAVSGGELLNDFTNPWPPDISVPPAQSYFEETVAPPSAESTLQPLTDGGCCTQPAWSADSTYVRFIDRPDDDPAGIWEVSIEAIRSGPQLFAESVAFYSAGYRYRIIVEGRTTQIESVDDGSGWAVPTGGQPVSISPGGERIVWEVPNGEDVAVERRVTDIRSAALDGSNAHSVVTLPRGSFGGWISDDAILVSSRDSLQSREDVLHAISLPAGEKTELARTENLRGATLSGNGSWLAYYIALNEDRMLNGLWVVRTDGTARQQLRRDLFGSYRWRDGHRLLIVPFRPGETAHQIIEFDAETGMTRPLTDPAILPFKITNNDWTVSPDGRKVAFVSATDYNLWLLTLQD